ncbi:prolipoprotein diacylglyceryl transferase [Falsihalocynthiibacter sp. SS001]|uniref:prolipoprotein diacylglyceryl transferase n=1 Tax=Falsihalocynthiibacter sp. SS001 TaxID=3349698 RepID=UPI0036D36C2C
MIAAIPFPDISSEVFSIDIGGFSFALRWYALAYIVGILIAWRLVVAALRRPNLWPNDTPIMEPARVEDFLTWAILGVVLGGRLGYVLFYASDYYLSHPLEILAVWQGGMSFHGGFLGVVAAAWLFATRNGISRLSMGDVVAMSVPAGLFLGRIANFINAELWGHPTDVPWAFIFPGTDAQYCLGPIGVLADGSCARHPSQLYEAGLEGLLLGALLLFLVFKREWLKTPGQTMGLFFAGYGAARFIVEFFRQADAQYITPENPMGYALTLGEWGLSRGQLLSLPMIIVGVAIILWARRAREAKHA